MSNLSDKRHTLAHLLAAAILKHYPDAKRTIGPAIDTGFYFDFEFPTEKPGDGDLEKIEATMKELLPTWTAFEHKEVSPEEAKEFYKDNPYKIELIEEFAGEGQTLTFYTVAGYPDLCRGGHSENPAKEISADSFKLERIAGAYWRGDEKNKMLTRIYGLAFDTKEELDAYLLQQEEAKKRDHRKIGKELKLFIFSELVGPGLPLWTPRGTLVRDLLDTFVWELRKEKGYQKVAIPHITKKDLYERSGHWAKYGDDLFRIKTREDNEYAMKPMNCPHHTQIFDSEQRSYRDMPQRFAETTMVYRDEQSGELSGLTRVLSITQDDAHVFCRENQIEEEVYAVWDIIDTFYGAFGFSLTPRFSRHDPENAEKYLGSPDVWKKAEAAMLSLIEKRNAGNYIDGLGEAAIYGPKIDFIAKDAIGRTHQVATIQLDFIQPENFDLVCTNEKGEKERIVMIHAAIMGSIERFSAVLLEHTAGILPLWLSPVQVRVLPVSEKFADYAQKVKDALKASKVRVELDLDNESLGKKIRNAKQEKIPYVVIVGEKEVESNTITVEGRAGKLDINTLEAFSDKLVHDISTRSLD